MSNNTHLNSGDYSTSCNMFVYNQIKEKTKCLDVGCWSGNLGKKLIENKHCIVDGADVQEDMLQFAKSKGYRNTYLINLNSDKLSFDALKDKYDVIIFADVLEHLINPEHVLTLIKDKLNKDGIIIISLPNVAFILNRLQLLLGKWEYREFGTLDKTHLKFYTIASGQKMVESTGLKVKKVIPYNQFGKLPYLDPINKLIPSILSYQFMMIAEKN